MLDIPSVLSSLRAEINARRRLLSLLEQAEFRILYAREHNVTIDFAIMSRNDTAVVDWYKQKRSCSLEDCTVRELRDLAKLRGIKNYQSKSKAHLLEDLNGLN